MLMRLTAEEIQVYAARKDVIEFVVMNFLAEVKNYEDIGEGLSDAINEAYRYNWNDETVVATALGIFKAGGVEV